MNKYKLYDSVTREVIGFYTIEELLLLYKTQSTANELYILNNINELKLLEYTEVKDKFGIEIYEDDILEDARGNTFRVYKAPGGFVIKANYWQENKEDLDGTDMLITDPLSDAQTYSYVSLQCAVVGNYNYK